MEIRKGNDSVKFLTSEESVVLKHTPTQIGEGGNAAAWSDIAESSQGTGDYVNQKPVARWAVPISDVVEGNTHTVAVVVEHTDPNDTIEAVHFYTDDDQVNPKVATLVDYTSTTTGITYPRWEYTLDASSWGTRQEREVRAVIIPTNGTTRILQGSTIDAASTLVPNSRTATGAPATDSPELNNIAAGLHSCWLYKWDGVTRQITPENLESAMGSITNPLGVVFTITSDGDVASGLSSAPWTVDVGDQRNSSIKVKSDGTRRVLSHNATFTTENNPDTDAAVCSMIWQGFEFDKTVQLGNGKKMTFVDIFSDRGLVPLNSSTGPNPADTNWVEYQAGPSASDPLHAGETWWCRNDQREIALDNSQTRVPGNTTTSIVKNGGNDEGVWHFECHYRHVESIVKKASACFGVKVEWAWLDTFSNTGCMVGCVSHELPYGYLAATDAQFHNDILQFIGRNFYNVLYHSSGAWRRSTDSIGIQGQLIHISDTNGSRAIRDFVMKDIAIIGNAAPGKGLAQNMNMNVSLRNTKWENCTIVQNQLSDASGNPVGFDKFSWNFEAIKGVKKSSGDFAWWKASWIAHNEEGADVTGTNYNTTWNYNNNDLYSGDRPELFKMKNCLGDGWTFGALPFGETTPIDPNNASRTIQDVYDENKATTATDIATLLFDVCGMEVIVPGGASAGVWLRNGFYVEGAPKTVTPPAGLSYGDPTDPTPSVPAGLTGCRTLLSGMPDPSADSFWDVS